MKNNKNRIEIRHLAAGSGQIERNLENDGVDRRGFLKCMAWAGTGMLWTVSGGVLASKILSPVNARRRTASCRAVSVSCKSATATSVSTKAANPDVIGTLKEAIAKINALPHAPDFILHTGDLTHLSEPEEFDTLDRCSRARRPAGFFMCPASTMCSTTTAKNIANASAGNSKGDGWYSFDHKGVHFIGLVNVMNLKAGGLGIWATNSWNGSNDDVSHLSEQHAHRGVRAHSAVDGVSRVGLGHGRQRAGAFVSQAFGSVTVLNGHIHQIHAERSKAT